MPSHALSLGAFVCRFNVASNEACASAANAPSFSAPTAACFVISVAVDFAASQALPDPGLIFVNVSSIADPAVCFARCAMGLIEFL
jgi:hypothetical protein